MKKCITRCVQTWLVVFVCCISTVKRDETQAKSQFRARNLADLSKHKHSCRNLESSKHWPRPLADQSGHSWAFWRVSRLCHYCSPDVTAGQSRHFCRYGWKLVILVYWIKTFNYAGQGVAPLRSLCDNLLFRLGNMYTLNGCSFLVQFEFSIYLHIY